MGLGSKDKKFTIDGMRVMPDNTKLAIRNGRTRFCPVNWIKPDDAGNETIPIVEKRDARK